MNYRFSPLFRKLRILVPPAAAASAIPLSVLLHNSGNSLANSVFPSDFHIPEILAALICGTAAFIAAYPAHRFREQVSRRISTGTGGTGLFPDNRNNPAETLKVLDSLTAHARRSVSSAPRLESLLGGFSEFSGAAVQNTEDTFENLKRQAISIIDLSASIEFIVKGIDDVGGKTSAMSSELQMLVNLIHNLSATAQELGEKIDSAVTSARLVSAEAIESQSRLNSATREMLNVIENSRMIGESLSVINDVSDRINLLALNAAIEAARAGNSGRGFAVVADEISKLAYQTAESVNEITGLLAGNSFDLEKKTITIQNAVHKTGDIMKKIETLHNEIGKIAHSIKDQATLNSIISNEAAKINTTSDAIETATMEQKLAVYEILTKVNDINDIYKIIVPLIKDTISRKNKVEHDIALLKDIGMEFTSIRPEMSEK